MDWFSTYAQWSPWSPVDVSEDGLSVQGDWGEAAAIHLVELSHVSFSRSVCAVTPLSHVVS